MKLTDNEIVHLCWDGPDLRRRSPAMADAVYKMRCGKKLTRDEAMMIVAELELVINTGCDEPAIGTRLLKKAAKLRSLYNL